MTNKLRLGLDIDGVVYDWSSQVRKMVKDKTGLIAPRAEDCPGWDDLQKWCGVGLWEWLWSPDGGLHEMFCKGDPYPASINYVRQLRETCDIVVITHVPPEAVIDRVSWLKTCLIPFDEFHAVPGSPKSNILPHCDIYLDDGPHNIVDLLANTKAEVAVWDRPWNRGGDIWSGGRLHRVDNWTDFVSLVEKVRDGKKS